MPQVQFVDQPNIGDALGKFGAGFLDQYTENLQRTREEDALEKAINEAQGSDDPLMSMLQAKGIKADTKMKISDIFAKRDDARKKKSFEEANQKRNDAKFDLSRQKYDLDLAKLDRKEKDAYAKESDPIKIGLNTLGRMEQLIDKGNLGKPAYILGNIPGTQTSADVASYATAGKSMIKLAARGIPIRNIYEFQVFADQLKDPYLSDAKKRGIVKEMRSQLEDGLDLLNQRYSIKQGPGKQSVDTEKPPITSFYR